MKPEEYLMQHYRYWTIPDLGLSEDERGYVEALRIGAEAIKEVERLRAENKQLSDQGFKAMTAQGVSLQLLAELESERKCLLDTGLFDNISELFHAWNELDDENEELKQRIEELTKTLADEAEHNDTAPHEGCSCQRCMMIRRIAELEAELLAAQNARQEWRSRLGLKSTDEVVIENDSLYRRVADLENELELTRLALVNAQRIEVHTATSTKESES